jgi:hypothetical protein
MPNKITLNNVDTLRTEDALKDEIKKLQEKLEHQRNLSRLRASRFYAKHSKIMNPEDRKKPGRKPKYIAEATIKEK